MFKHTKVHFFIGIILFSVFLITKNINALETETAIGLTDQERLWLTQNPVIHVGIDPAYAPIEMAVDEQHSGLTAGYLQLLEEKLGIRFILASNQSWATSLDLATSKQIDLLPAIQITPDRKKVLNFTEPYIFLDTAIITRVENLASEELTITDFKGKTVASVEGYFWTELLPQDYPEIKVVEVPSLAAGLLLISSGEVDSMFATYATAAHYIREQKISNLRVSGLTPYKIEYAMGLRSDWPEFAGIINKALNHIPPEQIQSLEDRWITLDFHIPWYNKKIVALYFLIATFAVFLALSWSYMLRRQVKVKTYELNQANERLEDLVRLRTKELETANQELTNSRRSLEESHTQLEQTNYRLAELAELDSLTQVANRHSLNQSLNKIIYAENFYGEPISLMMLDIDYFKAYNDSYGHLQGDECLATVAQTLKHLARRKDDLFARFGGEEFTLVLPGLSREKLEDIAMNALQSIRQLNIEHKGSDRKHLTISIGMVTVENIQDISPNELLEMADEALYAAKATGRDCFQRFRKKDELS